MHSPDSRQPLAHLRAASLPSPRRRMSTTPASTARGLASATPAASVIGQTSKHLPHCVQASASALMRSDNADSNVTAGLPMEHPGTIPGQLIAIQGPVSRPKTARLCARDVVPRDLLDVQRAHLPHDRDELVVQDLQHAVDASLTERGEAPHIGSADADSGGPEPKGLQNIGAAADAAIDEHRDAAAHG